MQAFVLCNYSGTSLSGESGTPPLKNIPRLACAVNIVWKVVLSCILVYLLATVVSNPSNILDSSWYNLRLHFLHNDICT